MDSETQDWILYVKKLYPYKNAVIIFILFGSGLVISLYSSYQTGLFWEILGKIGTFLSAIIAVSFIYNLYSKATSQALFLEDMRLTLGKTLQNYTIKSHFPKIHESGRLTIPEKVSFINDIKFEYIEIGVAMRTFVSYFTQRANTEFKNEIELLLKNGVNFKFYLLNPESKIAKEYAKERNETDLLANIKNSKNELIKLQKEFNEKGYLGKFEVYYYSHLPYFSLTFADKDTEDGKVMISNYLPIRKRAEMPVIETNKKINPVLYEKYLESFNIIVQKSQKIE